MYNVRGCQKIRPRFIGQSSSCVSLGIDFCVLGIAVTNIHSHDSHTDTHVTSSIVRPRSKADYTYVCVSVSSVQRCVHQVPVCMHLCILKISNRIKKDMYTYEHKRYFMFLKYQQIFYFLYILLLQCSSRVLHNHVLHYEIIKLLVHPWLTHFDMRISKH